MENSLSIKLRNLSQIYKDNIIALNNIFLDIHEGERVGIIGPNGSGKTTLLGIIADFMKPTSGEVEVHGSVNAVMSIGVVLREEMTGVENIYVDGELHGKTKEEVDAMISDIIEFADIGEYIDQPVRTYSSGMKARLSFSMLAFIEPEILIIDEVLGTGDKDFTVKSAKKIEELCSKGKILLVVSHSMGTILNMTERCIWLDYGKIMMDGEPKTVIKAYSESVRKKEEENLKNSFSQRIKSGKKDGKAVIRDFKLLTKLNENRTIFELREEGRVYISIETKEDLEEWDIRLSFVKMDGILMMQNEALEDGLILPDLKAGETVNIQIDIGEIAFAEGVYEVLCEILNYNEIIATYSNILEIENLVEFPASKPDYYCNYKWMAR